MRRVGVGLVILVLLSLFVPSAKAQVTGVALGQIILEDQRALTSVEGAARNALLAQNLNVVPRSQADYVVNVYHKDTERRRSFNWWILLLPIWPIMGITEAEVTVAVDSQVVDNAGTIVWQGAGEASASTIWFSDFRYPGTERPLAEATGRALRGAGALAVAEPFVDIAWDGSLRLGLGAAF